MKLGSDRGSRTLQRSPLRRKRRAAAESEIEMPQRLIERAMQGPSQMAAGDVAHLQRAIGNQAVSRLVEHHETEEPVPAQAPAPVPANGSALSGTESASFALELIIPSAARRPAQPAPVRTRKALSTADSAEEESEPVTVKQEPGKVVEEEADAVTPTLAYTAAVGARATPPSATQFGVTSTNVTVNGLRVEHVTPTAPLAPGVVTGAVSALIGMFSGGAGGTGSPTVATTPPPTANYFRVTAGIHVQSNWSVHGLGRTDITSADSPAVTADNYTDAAGDLRPNMSSDGGRPRRTNFWASDLTATHERFHANERTGTYGRAAFDFARAWLATQTATTVTEATALVNQMPAKMFESYNASFVPGKETRAYGDGAPSYLARSAAILARGATLDVYSGISSLFGGP